MLRMVPGRQFRGQFGLRGVCGAAAWHAPICTGALRWPPVRAVLDRCDFPRRKAGRTIPTRSHGVLAVSAPVRRRQREHESELVMSIRTALVSMMLTMGALTLVLVGGLGSLSVDRNILREAQERVNHDLDTVCAHYDERMRLLAALIDNAAKDLALDNTDLRGRVQRLREELGLAVLNVCDATGTPLGGAYPELDASVPVQSDPVLGRAQDGQVAWGTVLLDADRLLAEGGVELCDSLAVPDHGVAGNAATKAGLFWWVAAPIRDTSDKMVGLLYGGRALNLDFQLVDDLRDLVFGTRDFEGKPLGTVTVFLEDLRVATNVRGPDHTRAVGTRVSPAVRQKVLVEGGRWQDRALVVDEWYLSAYKPVRDPDGHPIGMLYVGLLEAPYAALRGQLIASLLGIGLVLAIVAVAITIYVVRRITSPLRDLSTAATGMARGDQVSRVTVPQTYSELRNLTSAFREMQDAVALRDRRLLEHSRELEQTNDKLERANRNYMQTLGFVTHELKSPLAAMQSIISVIVEGYVGDVPEKITTHLQRIKRNAEELQDMVKNYLDLSRAERGELVANKSAVDFRAMVVEPCVQQVQPLFSSRNVQLEVQCPPTVDAHADQELLRIALANYLSNAAKYGREGGKARLEVREENGQVVASVWNEGAGFTSEDAEKLFGKFSRLQNENTRGRRGSGLGLFLCRQIAELHAGKAWAESEPGQWARFIFSFPANAG